ncbi:hypothetical protein DOY81_014244, partial [Sarcophaga bullata]
MNKIWHKPLHKRKVWKEMSLLSNDLSVRYPKPLDLVHYVVALFSYQIENDKYVAFVNLYLERWRCITTALASCIDYMRLSSIVVI